MHASCCTNTQRAADTMRDPACSRQSAHLAQPCCCPPLSSRIATAPTLFIRASRFGAVAATTAAPATTTSRSLGSCWAAARRAWSCSGKEGDVGSGRKSDGCQCGCCCCGGCCCGGRAAAAGVAAGFAEVKRGRSSWQTQGSMVCVCLRAMRGRMAGVVRVAVAPAASVLTP